MTATGPTPTRTGTSGPDGAPIVAGIDGSDTARAALATAVRLAALSGVGVVAVHAVGLMDEIGGDHVPAFGHRGEIADALRSWCAGVDGGEVEPRLEEGSPVDVLLRVALDTGASLIVVGRRGIGGRPDLLLGSTAHQVLERTDRPVLVVPPPNGR